MSEKLSRETVKEALADVIPDAIPLTLGLEQLRLILDAAQAYVDQEDALVIRPSDSAALIEVLRLSDYDYMMLAKAGTPEHPQGKAGYLLDCLIAALSDRSDNG